MQGLCVTCDYMWGILKHQTPIHTALQNGHVECAHQAIAHGGNIYDRTPSGLSCLDSSIIKQSVDCVRLCLDMNVPVGAYEFRTWREHDQSFEIGWIMCDYQPNSIPDALFRASQNHILRTHIKNRMECLFSCRRMLVMHRTQVLPPDVICTIVKHLWSMRKNE